MLGDTERADVAFASANEALMTEVETTTKRGQYRPDYGSVLRDAAAILALATDAKAKPEVIRTAMSAIEVERARTCYASTQDMAWMVLAARAIVREAETSASTSTAPRIDGGLNKTSSGQRTGEGRAHRQHRDGCGPGRRRRLRLARMSQSPKRRTA